VGRFDERATQPARGLPDVIRWYWARLRAPRDPNAQPDAPAPRRPNDGALLGSPTPSITWIGHASFVLRLGGKLVAIDPVWSERLAGVAKRLVAPGVPLPMVPRLDLVLVTHNHRDHLDLPTLARFGPEPTYVVPLGNGELLRKNGAARVVELDWWQSHPEGELEVTLVPARHWSSRVPWDRNEMLWGGYVLRGPEGAAYHSGDTGFFDDFKAIGSRLGPIDWAMLPIGAYEPRWFMQPQHMNPDDAGRAFELLAARNFVAMHWGTFKLTDEPTTEPPEKIRAWWRERAMPEERLWVMDVGETRPLR
jgi:L-ascorbate metabolism protein UlaG (beta-lactamase superfamily)